MRRAVGIDVAREVAGAGLNVLPPMEDGTKRPLAAWRDERGATWKTAETVRTDDRLSEWFGQGRDGIGAVMGAVSDHVECIDFDLQVIADEYVELAHSVGLGELVDRVMAGYSEDTPNGRHLFLRCPPALDEETGELVRHIGGNTKLARKPEPKPDNPNLVKTLIETKGEGGYIIMAPSGGAVHPDRKAYTVRSGSPATIATVTPDERRALLDLARTFDQMPVAEQESAKRSSSTETDRPGDLFNTNAAWSDILGPHGWKRVSERNGVVYWRRPGKTQGVSATTNHTGRDTLIVFSSSTPFDTSPSSYSKFAAYSVLNHGGDHSAAAKALYREGYGSAKAERGSFGTGSAPAANEPVRERESDWPAPPGPTAFYGLAGDIVRAVDPFTEADPVAVLVNVLAAFGACAGPSPHFLLGADRHPARTNFVITGQSSKARKGMSQGPVSAIFERADPYFNERLVSGLSTGEGLIARVRDRVERQVTNPKTNEVETVVEDEGVTDKRLQVIEPELGRVLRVIDRQGNTLSAIVRDSWDWRDLSVLTKAATRATKPHIVLVGHVTVEELRRELDANDRANGFANRWVWVAVKRSKELPLPEPFEGPIVDDLANRIASALAVARRTERMHFDDDAAQLWIDAYHELSADHDGLAGAILNRAEPHTLRLAMLYALLDGSSVIGVPHLAAAMELFDFAERSTRYIFGDATGDPMADRIHKGLMEFGPLSRTDIRDLFDRHADKAAIDAALLRLRTAGKAETWREPAEDGGRPREMWRAVR